MDSDSVNSGCERQSYVIIFFFQIATGGGIISHLVHLKVVEPRAVIPGDGQFHVETGSTITLDCIIEQVSFSPFQRRFAF